MLFRSDVAAAADGDHELGLELFEDSRGGFLAELVDLKWLLVEVHVIRGCCEVDETVC